MASSTGMFREAKNDHIHTFIDNYLCGMVCFTAYLWHSRTSNCIGDVNYLYSYCRTSNCIGDVNYLYSWQII